jgi:GNAT superfamily N-acetyltransferase
MPAVVTFRPVTASEGDELASIRVEAMRDSLERIGRFDEARAAPGFQGRGFGSLVLARVFAEADAQRVPVRVGALRESESNAFYRRHGFVLVEQAEHDNYYERAPLPVPRKE